MALNTIIPSTLIADRVAFYHATLFSPVKSTEITAVNAGHFATWPDITAAQIRRHFPVSVHMHLGHMDQSCANQQSTKGLAPTTYLDTEQDTKPPPIPDRTNAVYVDLHDVTGQVYSDQTGRFPTVFSSGNNYLKVVYKYDSNFIQAEPLKSRSGPEIHQAYTNVHRLFLQRGLERVSNGSTTKPLAPYWTTCTSSI